MREIIIGIEIMIFLKTMIENGNMKTADMIELESTLWIDIEMITMKISITTV